MVRVEGVGGAFLDGVVMSGWNIERMSGTRLVDSMVYLELGDLRAGDSLGGDEGGDGLVMDGGFKLVRRGVAGGRSMISMDEVDGNGDAGGLSDAWVRRL